MGSVVYVVEAGGLFKIGRTTNVVSRLRSIQTSVPSPLTLLGVVDGGRAEERLLHDEFADCREHGEWFRLSPEHAADLCSRLRPANEAIRANPTGRPGRPRKPPTTVVRLPLDVVEALKVRAARKDLTLGEYLRAALK